VKKSLIIFLLGLLAFSSAARADDILPSQNYSGKYGELNYLLNHIREIEISAMQEVHDSLVKALPPTYSVTRVIKGLNLDDLKVENRNDYRNYIWVEVKIEDREWFITAIFQDQDFETGNMHHQYGRFQFWTGIKHYSKKWCSTPNRPTGDGHWTFNYENSFDPKIKIYDPDFSAQAVVDAFISFLRQCGEKL